MRGELFKGIKQWEFEQAGRKFKLPVFYYDNTSITAIYTASTSKVKKLLPHPAMNPIEMFPGRCMLAFTAFEYRKTDIDPYNEFSIAFLITFDKPQIPGSRLSGSWRDAVSPPMSGNCRSPRKSRDSAESNFTAILNSSQTSPLKRGRNGSSATSLKRGNPFSPSKGRSCPLQEEKSQGSSPTRSLTKSLSQPTWSSTLLNSRRAGRRKQQPCSSERSTRLLKHCGTSS